MRSKVEIWDELGWIIAKGKISPEEAGLALDEAVASLSAAATPNDTAVENESPLTAVSCPLTADRRSVNGDKGRATFMFRVLTPDKVCPTQRPVGNGTDPSLMGFKATEGETAESVRRDVSEIQGKVRTAPDREPCLSQQHDTAAVTPHTTNLSDDRTRPSNATVAGFDDIDDLLGFSPHDSGGSESVMTSSLSGTASASNGDDAGCFSSALGKDLLGTVVDNPLDKSWSSAEEGKDFGSEVNLNESKNESTVRSPGSAIVDVTPAAARAETTEQAESPSPTVGSGGVPGSARREESSPTLSDTRTNRASDDAPSVATEIGPDEGLAADVSSPENICLPLQPSDDGVVSPAGSSSDYTNYSDEEYENEEDGGSEDGARASGARSVLSFSSASSESSFHDGFDGDDGGGSDGHDKIRVRQHARVEVAVTAAAVKLRQRLRRAAEKCGSGSGDGSDVKAGVKLLFNSLDEVGLIIIILFR